MRQFLGRGTSGEREADIIRLNVSGVVLETCSGNLLLYTLVYLPESLPKANGFSEKDNQLKSVSQVVFPYLLHPIVNPRKVLLHKKRKWRFWNPS